MLQKAGVALPWTPHNWSDVLAAARAVKAKVPGVAPLWIAAGTSAGPTGVLQGSGALVYASSTPVIYDTNTGKYVTDSPGLREVFQFYKDVYSGGLGAPLSDLFSPKAVGRAGQPDGTAEAGDRDRLQLVWRCLEAQEPPLGGCRHAGGRGGASHLARPAARPGRHNRRLGRRRRQAEQATRISPGSWSS